MKKLTYILALCLCLNGTAALATAAEDPTQAQPPAAQVEAGAPAENGTPAASASAEDGTPAASAESAAPSEETPAANAGEPAQEEAAEPPAAVSDEPGNVPAEPGTSESSESDNAAEPATPVAPAAPVEPAAPVAPETHAEPDAPAVAAPAADDANPDAAPVEPDADSSAEARFEAASGTLEELLNQVSGKGTVFLRVGLSDRVYIKAAPLRKLADLALLPDGEVFPGSGWTVYVSTDEPKGNDKPALVDPADYRDAAADATAELYFWVDKKGKYDEPAPSAEPTSEPAPKLTVAAENCAPGQWSAEMPSFTLSGIPEGKAYTYAAIIYDERFVPLSGNTYAPTAEGKYNLRFAMLDGIGDIVSASDTYALMLDATAPESVTLAADEAVSYTLNLTATDSLSGVEAVSLDGGATWTPLSNEEKYTYTAGQKTTLSPGAVQVRDAAGNIWRNKSELVLESVEPEPEPGGGGGGGGGGSGEKKPNPSHASGDGEEGAAYETLELELPDAPMKQLIVGGEVMALTLSLDEAEAEDAPVGEAQPFTAQLRAWRPAPAGEDGHENVLTQRNAEQRNTLLLTAVTDANLGDAFTYTWRFNGEVYRMLANSGIRYVALQVGDDIAAFSTEGFIGGTKYTELKMLGVSTRKFDYALTMKVNRDPLYVSTMSDSDFSRDCDLSVRAEVENMAYELSGSTNSIMYFYDVYLGPADMLEQPFGQYSAE